MEPAFLALKSTQVPRPPLALAGHLRIGAVRLSGAASEDGSGACRAAARTRAAAEPPGGVGVAGRSWEFRNSSKEWGKMTSSQQHPQWMGKTMVSSIKRPRIEVQAVWTILRPAILSRSRGECPCFYGCVGEGCADPAAEPVGW